MLADVGQPEFITMMRAIHFNSQLAISNQLLDFKKNDDWRWQPLFLQFAMSNNLR